MKKICLETRSGKYNGLYRSGLKNKDIAFVYYHGLNGNSKIVQPLEKNLKDFDFYSMEERGHKNSLQKPSTSIKKHEKDLFNVINHLRPKYKKIFLCGESMGGLFVARYAYKWNNVDAVFSWSIPFNPKDIMKERKTKKFYIFFRVFLCFIFNINYKYISEVDYPKLTNSKFLLKLNEMEIKSEGSTAEEIAIWKASLGIKRKFLKSNPKIPIYYWQGDQDIMVNDKLLEKIIQKKKVNINIIKGAKHILMFEEGAQDIFDKMNEIAND